MAPKSRVQKTRHVATSFAPSERGPSSSDHMWNRITTHGNVAGCWQVAGELAEPNAASMLLDVRTRCARCELAGRNDGLPRWRRGPRPTSLCCCQRRNSCTLYSHTHTRSTPAGTYSRSLPRPLAQRAGRRRQAAERADRERAGQVNGAMIIMTLATMSCGGCERRRCAAAAI